MLVPPPFHPKRSEVRLLLVHLRLPGFRQCRGKRPSAASEEAAASAQPRHAQKRPRNEAAGRCVAVPSSPTQPHLLAPPAPLLLPGPAACADGSPSGTALGPHRPIAEGELVGKRIRVWWEDDERW